MLAMGISPSTRGADDYILEEHFHTTLAKAESGDARAQYAVGEMLLTGRGAELNETLAYEWISRAAAQNHLKAIFKLGFLHLVGAGIEQDPAKAYSYFRLAADQDYGPAQFHLAKLYAQGLGVTKDNSVALSLFGKAKQNGYDPAHAEFANLVQQLVDAQPTSGLLNTKNIVINGHWALDGQPAHFLPSATTRCRDLGHRIDCATAARRADAPDALRTQAQLSAFDTAGNFQVTYQQRPYSNNGATPRQAGAVTHTVDCTVVSQGTIDCNENNTRIYSFSRH
jgi:hypothetical protein